MREAEQPGHGLGVDEVIHVHPSTHMRSLRQPTAVVHPPSVAVNDVFEDGCLRQPTLPTIPLGWTRKGIYDRRPRGMRRMKRVTSHPKEVKAMARPHDPRAEGPAIIDIRRPDRPDLDDDTLVGAYRTDLRLHQDRSPTTCVTYDQNLEAFRRWLTNEHPYVSLPDVQGAHIKAFVLAEAARGIAPSTRSTVLFSLRSFYRFLMAEDVVEVNPAANVTIPRIVLGPVEFYSDSQADTIIAWATAQPGRRWQVGRVPSATAACGSTSWQACVPRRSTSTPGASPWSERAGSFGWSRSPVCWPRCCGSTSKTFDLRSRLRHTCSSTRMGSATAGCSVGMGLGRSAASCTRPDPRQACPVGTSPIGGATPTPRA